MHGGVQANELARRQQGRLRGQSVARSGAERVSISYPQSRQPSPQALPNRAGALADIPVPRGDRILINDLAIRK
jgi:hypothetical protein